MAVAIIAGIVYEKVGQRQGFNEIPRIGRSVDIGGRSLNINCTGQGSPPMILDSGANNPAMRGSWFNRWSPALVASAGIRPPYLLVGHRFGGTNMSVYSGLYPSDVAGMVLVDAWHENELKRQTQLKGSGPPDTLRPDALTPAFTRIGLVRLFQRPLRNSPPKRGRHVVVENSTHGIPWEAPDIVAASIRELVTTISPENRR